MKHYNKLMLATLLGAATVSCADDKLADYQVDKPESIARYEYLNAYDALKTYINPNANPDFKLGAGIAVSDFLKGDLVYSMATANFAELTAGNAMKYASCVKNDGSMDFDQVFKFVQAAKAAGLTIYGHTLAWHSQQNNKYLNSLIADKELDVDPDAKVDVEDYVVDYSTTPYTFWHQAPDGTTFGINSTDGCLEIINPAATDHNYQVQYHTGDNLPILAGKEYKLKMMVRGSGDGTLDIGVGPWSGRATTSFNFTTEWKELEFPFTAVADGGHVMTQSGRFVGTIQIKHVKITHAEAMAVEVEQEIRERTYQDGPFPFYAMGCEPPVINGAIHFVPTGAWAQFFILPGGENALSEGDYVAYLDIKASKNASGILLTMQNGWGGDAQKIEVPISVKEGTQILRLNFPKIEGGNYDVILKPQNADATLDLKSIRICKVVKMNSIPLSPEEKKANLIEAMDKWIAGMMENTAEYVSVWDVVNEAIAGGGDNGEGFYPLQSASTASASDAASNFYWQDYLGSEDYVRIVVASARKHYVENGGTKPLQLFINDYNLESDWDDNKKLKSLVHWIEKWEADGKTKIDGIGTQMHVSYYANANTQKSKEDHIVKMLEILAKSGKLVKISELDMGYIDEGGNSVKTENITFEQQKQMADFYTFIIKKYFEIIPKAQQYGITQWATTDSPAGSGWREGQPIGLWDLSYNRKPTYAGFVEGLK